MDGPTRVLYIDPAPDGTASTDSLETEAAVDVLRADGFETGLEAIEEADCVVCVHRSTDLDGQEFLEAVRERRPAMPVVVYAPEGDRAAGREHLAAGATDWVPVAPDAEPPEVFENRVMNAVESTHRSTNDLEGTLDRIVDAVFALDDEWRFAYVNERAEQLLECEESELLGTVIWEAFPEAVGSTFQQKHERAMETQMLTVFEEFFPPLEKWFAGQAYPSEPGLSVYFRDVTERVERERALKESEERYRTLAENFPRGAVGLFDHDLRYTLVSGAIWDELDYDAADLEGHTVSEALPPATAEKLEPLFHAALDGETKSVQAPFADRIFNVWATPIHDADGEVIAGMNFFQDVTDRVEYERELEQYRAVTEAASDAIVVIDEESTVISANPAVVNVFGYEPDALVGEPITKLMADDVAVAHREALARYLRTGERSFEWDYVELPGRHRDGHEVPLAISLDEYVYDGRRYFAGVIRDNTERKKREWELERYETIVETVGDGVYVANADARFTFVNDALVAMTGYDRSELLGAHTSTVVSEDIRDQADEMTGELLTGEREEAVIETELRTADGARVPTETRIVPFPFADGSYGRVGIVRDITERRRFERTLTTLHEATRDLVRAESSAEVCQIAVETATEVLDLSGVGVYLYDPDHNELYPETYSADAGVVHDELPTLQPGESVTGHVFVTGETLVIDDAAESERLAHNPTNLQSALFVPLSDHGVLIAGSTSVGAFGDRTVQLVDLLSATTEAALDRVAREDDLREREQEMRRQAIRLERLAHLTENLRAVERALVAEETREGIEEAVCEALVETERFAFAWIGESDRRTGTVTPRAWAGDTQGYLEAVSPPIDADEATEPAGRTAATGQSALVADVSERLREAPWRGEALTRGLRSVLSVPVAYNEVTYGVLSVYATEPQGFDELAADVFTELADTVAFAINSTETKRALTADRVIELELAVRGGEGVLPEIARQADCQVEFEGEVPSTEGTGHVFFTAQGAPHDQIVAVLEDAVGVEAIEVIAGEGDERLYRATVSGATLAGEFASLGAMVRAVTAVGNEARIVVELPRTADVRAFVTAIESRYPDVELLARRERHRPTLTRRAVMAELNDRLTDRQQEALRTAYLSGFFETPRASTGVELGRMLDISQPTFTAHLRAAERKLLGLLYGDATEPG